MSSERAARIGPIAAIVVLSLAGCGRPAGVIFDPMDPPLQWPAAPETARIEYIGALVTDHDLRPARSFTKVVGDKLFGEPDARSMLSPYDVCTDGDGRVFVSDSNAQVVHVFDLDARRYERWSAVDGGAALAQPLGLEWDPAGRLLVADGVGGRIAVFDSEGRGRGALGEGQLQRPTDVKIDPSTGRLLVVDATAHQIVELDPEGNVVRRMGRRGTVAGRFNFPTNLTVDATGRVYVADSMNFRVQVLDAGLAPVRQVGRLGDRPGYFSHPKGIALDGDGHLYVVDAHFEAVQIFDTEGRLLLSFGREGRGPGEFWLPAGIHIDAKNRIWIADSYNRRVQVFQYLGGEIE